MPMRATAEVDLLKPIMTKKMSLERSIRWEWFQRPSSKGVFLYSILEINEPRIHALCLLVWRYRRCWTFRTCFLDAKIVEMDIIAVGAIRKLVVRSRWQPASTAALLYLVENVRECAAEGSWKVSALEPKEGDVQVQAWKHNTNSDAFNDT